MPPRRSLKRTASMVQVSALSRRIHGWSWQAFPIGMGTGAVYVTLAGLKDHWGSKLDTVETVFFFFNLVLFILNTTTLLLQLLLYPRQARRLVTDSAKCIYVPLMLLSFATIIIGTINYAIPRKTVGPNFIYVLFWLYVGLSVGVCFPLLMIFFNKPHDLNKFTPAWAFLIFPMMLVGVVAYNVLNVIALDEPRALGILLTAYAFQGLGFFMTMFYICIYILRVITTGFMDGAQASGAFVACGPPGFTALALIHLGEDAREIVTARQLLTPMAGEIWYVSSVLAALLLFGLAVFFFVFGALPYWYKLHRSLKEILGCWSLTFPNVGWILAISKIGDTFNIQGFYIWSLVMTIIMCATWIVLFVLTAVAFWEGKIFNSKPEDVIRDMYYADEKLQVKDIERRLSVVERSMHRINSRHERNGPDVTPHDSDGCEMMRMTTTRDSVVLPTLSLNQVPTSPSLSSDLPPPSV
ncbi:voltage-dependent anion channel-domain-containing protein [Irpex rosettiformis]|uniref:Voltage-dependent anion channel-domain-containing protein n=1 Tax=Irpex rosettiformis TaxID=378272 RepID=A0ACB8UG12_9APHY|nr:voltage-dependent anion channel-domain-containing protein [Irpex rosettiformis]